MKNKLNILVKTIFEKIQILNLDLTNNLVCLFIGKLMYNKPEHRNIILKIMRVDGNKYLFSDDIIICDTINFKISDESFLELKEYLSNKEIEKLLNLLEGEAIDKI